MNNIDLSGRAAVITGGARGIGFATALLMWIYNIVVKPASAADASPAD